MRVDVNFDDFVIVFVVDVAAAAAACCCWSNFFSSFSEDDQFKLQLTIPVLHLVSLVLKDELLSSNCGTHTVVRLNWSFFIADLAPLSHRLVRNSHGTSEKL